MYIHKGINAENAALIFHQHFESHLPFQHSVSQYRHIPEFYVQYMHIHISKMSAYGLCMFKVKK